MTVLSAFINYSFGYNLGTTELNARKGVVITVTATATPYAAARRWRY